MSTDFKEIVEGARAAFTEDPAAAMIKYETSSRLDSGCRVVTKSRDHELVVDEPTEFGGTDMGAGPAEVLMTALASCQIITYQFYAGAMGIPLDDVEIEMEGDLDLRGFLGMDDSIRPGLQAIRAKVTVHSSASAEQIDALKDAVAKYCPMLNSVSQTTPVEFDVKHQQTSEQAAQ